LASERGSRCEGREEARDEGRRVVSQRESVEDRERLTGALISSLECFPRYLEVVSSVCSEVKEGERWSGNSLNFSLIPFTFDQFIGLRELVY